MPTILPDALPLVSLVMPVRNEAAHLSRALEAVDAQTYPRERMEVVVVDGGSIDGTMELVRSRMATDARVSLLGGPGVNTPAAMNMGTEAAHGDIVVKVDGHGWMNPPFVELAVTAFAHDPALGCVGGLIQPFAESTVERAIALARFSVLGVGGGVYTLDARVQDVDTVQCGAYRRAALMAVGGFDPAMAYGEDEEVNHRIRQAGWRIQLQPGMRFAYRVRSSLGALFRQYARYGRARVAVVRKHPGFLRAKHLAPAAMVMLLTAGLVALLVPSLRPVTVVIWGGYAAVIIAGAVWLSLRVRFAHPHLVAGALVALHLGYGVGFLRGLPDRPVPVSRDEGETPPPAAD